MQVGVTEKWPGRKVAAGIGRVRRFGRKRLLGGFLIECTDVGGYRWIGRECRRCKAGCQQNGETCSLQDWHGHCCLLNGFNSDHSGRLLRRSDSRNAKLSPIVVAWIDRVNCAD